MHDSIKPTTCVRLNERRQAQVVADISDEHEVVGSGCMGYMQGTDWISKAVGADLDGPLDDDGVARIVDYYRARGATPTLELTAYSDEQTLAAVARAGFGLAEVEQVFSRATAHLDVAPPDGITIQALDPADEAAMRRHAEIVCSGLAESDAAVPATLLESSVRSQRNPNAMGFFACLPDGECVAATGMEITTIRRRENRGTTKIAALWGTTVLPPYRRRGLQLALIAHRLSVGLERGCTLGVIQSKPGISTERNAARLGFLPSYTRMTLKAPAG